jgi:hypothetical protein
MNIKSIKWKRGDVHPVSGMYFWQYSKICKNGEYWITAEKYNQNKEYHAKYRKNNRDLIIESKRKHKLKDPDRYRALGEIYRSRRREKILAYESRRLKEDPLFALAHLCRSRIRSIFKAKKVPKTQKSRDLIGCDWGTLKLHFESRFSDGMSWGNRGLWHIDHIVPLALAKSLDEVIKLCHYTNLQPLWAKDNLSKGCKLQQQPKKQ